LLLHRWISKSGIRKSEQNFRDIIELATDGIFQTGLYDQYIDVNPTGCKMLGYVKNEIIGKHLLDFVAEEDAPRLAALLQEFVLNEQARLMRERYVGCVVVTDEIKGKQIPLGIITDRDLVLEVVAAEADPNQLSASDIVTQRDRSRRNRRRLGNPASHALSWSAAPAGGRPGRRADRHHQRR
jgi:PAS domain-containing protein